MPLSTNPTFDLDKLKTQASEFQLKLDGYTYEEVLLAVRSRQISQCYVRQVQRAQIFVQQVTTSHELSSKLRVFTQSWSGQPMTWIRWLTMCWSSSLMDQRESFSRVRTPYAQNIPPTTLRAFHMRFKSRALTQSWHGICDVKRLVCGRGTL